MQYTKNWSISLLSVSLCLCGLLLINKAHAGAIDKLHSFFETTRSMRADFAQIVVAKNGKRPQQSTGVMMFSRPGKFRWQIERPYSQLLVGDGKKIWIYDPDLLQVTVKKFDAALGSSPVALLVGESDGKGRETLPCAKPASERVSNGWRRSRNRRTVVLRNCCWGFSETISSRWSCSTISDRSQPCSFQIWTVIHSYRPSFSALRPLRASMS